MRLFVCIFLVGQDQYILTQTYKKAIYLEVTAKILVETLCTGITHYLSSIEHKVNNLTSNKLI